MQRMYTAIMCFFLFLYFFAARSRGAASLHQSESIILMIPGSLHYSQRSSSAVQINYHWSSINGSFQILPQRMPLICAQLLSGVERSASVARPCSNLRRGETPHCPRSLPHCGRKWNIMIDINYCGSRLDLFQVANFAFFFSCERHNGMCA